jgi:uncharacterized LabA/DUF88 family protein
MKGVEKEVFAFIDSQNLNLGTLDFGWKLDFAKFRLYLRNKYSVKKAYLFIGYIEKNAKLYQKLQEWGYILIFKPVLSIKKDKKITYKGNVDAELVLHTMIQKENFQKAIIISGDGDFYCLVEYLCNKELLEKVMTPNSKYSSLLREFGRYIVDITPLRNRLEYKRRHSRGKQG